MKKLLIVLLVLSCHLAAAQEGPTAHRVDVPAETTRAVFTRTFYTGTLNWSWQPGASGSLSMRGYGSTASGGTINQVTACFFSESSFIRRFTATVSVVQGTRTIQAITFAREFPANQLTCHTLTNFNAAVAPGDFAVVVSYSKFDYDNVFAGLAATDSGLTFDVQIGFERPPYADGDQGRIQMRGVGIKYRIDENDEPPPPLPPPGCVRDAYTACLLSGRFKVTARWQTATDSGPAQVMYFGLSRAENDQSVFMWFFSGLNFEMAVKMVDACASPSNRYWAFVSGLTNQAFTVTIEDTQTGAVWTHTNPLDQLPLTRGDTAAFACPQQE